MKGSKLKIILIATAILFLGSGGAIYYASTQITPEQVRNIITKSLNETFPGADIMVGDVDYSLGTSVKFHVKEVSMKVKENRVQGWNKRKRDLVELENLDLHIPVWAILTSGGTLDVYLERPKFGFFEYDKKNNNWLIAMAKEKGEAGSSSSAHSSTSQGQTSSSGTGEVVEIPGFLKSSKLNIKITDSNVKYSLATREQGSVKIERFVVKGLNFQETTAFELATQIESLNSNREKLSLNALIIGDADLGKYVRDKELTSHLIIKLSQIKVPGLARDIQSFNSDVKLKLDKSSVITAEVSSELEQALKSKLKIRTQNSSLKIHDLDLTVHLKEMADLTGFKNSQIKLGESQLKATGSFSQNAKGIKYPDLKLELLSPIQYVVDNDLTLENHAKGTFKGKKLVLDMTQKFWNGQALTQVKTQVNLNNLETNVKKLPPIIIKSRLKNIRVSKGQLQKVLYSRSSKVPTNNSVATKSGKKNAATSRASKKQAAPALYLPTVKLDLAWSDLSIGNSPFTGRMNLLAQKNTIGSRNLNFKFSLGEGKVSFHTTFLKNESSKTRFSFKLKKLDLESLNAFLPPKLESVRGKFTGKVKGSLVSSPAAVRYDLDTDLNAENGEIKGLNITDKVHGLISSLPYLNKKVKKKEYKVSDKFETLAFKGKLKHDHYKLNRFHFVGIRNKIELKGSGNLYPEATRPQGKVDLTMQDKTGKISRVLQKEVGTDIVPVRLTGPQFNLNPDYGYTLSRLSKRALKTQAKSRGKKALEKVIKKNKLGDKLFKNKDVKKLFKGLF